MLSNQDSANEHPFYKALALHTGRITLCADINKYVKENLLQYEKFFKKITDKSLNQFAVVFKEYIWDDLDLEKLTPLFPSLSEQTRGVLMQITRTKIFQTSQTILQAVLNNSHMNQDSLKLMMVEMLNNQADIPASLISAARAKFSAQPRVLCELEFLEEFISVYSHIIKKTSATKWHAMTPTQKSQFGQRLKIWSAEPRFFIIDEMLKHIYIFIKSF